MRDTYAGETPAVRNHKDLVFRDALLARTLMSSEPRLKNVLHPLYIGKSYEPN